MQEEVEHKTVNFAIQATKVSLKLMIRALEVWKSQYNRIKQGKCVQAGKANGKQTVKQLIGQDKGVSGIELADGGLKDFERVAKKYGVDFAIVKDKSADQPRYTVFFKARDKDAIDLVLKEYGIRMNKRKMNKAKRASILQKLNKFKAIAASIPRKEKRKEQIR